MKKISYIAHCAILLVFVALAVSCSKGDAEVAPVTGEATVSVSLGGVDGGEEVSVKMASASGEVLTDVQEVRVPFSADYTLVATLQAKTSGTAVRQKVGVATGNSAAAAAINPVSQGVLYRVVVYNGTGQYVSDQVYTVGSSTNAMFQLDAGKPYTFIAYSINSSSSVPAVNTQQNLSAATLSAVSGSSDFMYFKTNFTLAAGTNNLNVVLKHLFSQITTKIDATAVGTIENCSASIAPHYSSVGIKLTDAAISYNGTVSQAALSFGAMGTVITSTPTLVSAPATSSGVLTIASIKAGGTTRTNLSVNNLQIVPGVKYNLNLTLSRNGIELGGYTWAPANLVYNNGSYGFAANQGEYGDQWQVNALLPINMGSGSEGQQTYDAAKDPCRKVTAYGGNWRTPTITQLQTITGASRNQKPIFHVRYDLAGQPRASYNGVGGLFVGTTTQPAQADIDKYIFLPYAGENGYNKGGMGTYWTVTPSSANNERFQFNTGDVSWPYTSQYYNYGGSIRCVKQ